MRRNRNVGVGDVAYLDLLIITSQLYRITLAADIALVIDIRCVYFRRRHVAKLSRVVSHQTIYNAISSQLQVCHKKRMLFVLYTLPRSDFCEQFQYQASVTLYSYQPPYSMHTHTPLHTSLSTSRRRRSHTSKTIHQLPIFQFAPTLLQHTLILFRNDTLCICLDNVWTDRLHFGVG